MKNRLKRVTAGLDAAAKYAMWWPIPPGLLFVSLQIWFGAYFQAVMIAVWCVMSVLAGREIRRWRERANSEMSAEREDQNRFVCAMVMAKGAAASAWYQRCAKLGIENEPQCMGTLLQLFEEVVSIELPEDAPDYVVSMQRKAMDVLREGFQAIGGEVH